MLVLGIDVVVLFCFGLCLTVASYMTARFVPMEKGEGTAAVTATFLTAMFMVVAYIVMARILDLMFGSMGW